jgi:acetyltransferase-like isoleucine patch superfamily enzyme
MKLTHLAAGAVGRLVMRGAGVEAGGGLILHGAPICEREAQSVIRLGERVVLCSWSNYTALGVTHPVILRTLLPGAEILVGDDVGVSGATICAALRIEIGHRCLLGANVTIVDTDFHPEHPMGRRFAALGAAERAAVRIGDDVFIGANSMVLKGTSIGNNTVIGAGSIVTGKIPANVIAAGNPCRVLRPLETASQRASPAQRRQAMG